MALTAGTQATQTVTYDVGELVLVDSQLVAIGHHKFDATVPVTITAPCKKNDTMATAMMTTTNDVATAKLMCDKDHTAGSIEAKLRVTGLSRAGVTYAGDHPWCGQGQVAEADAATPR